MKVDNILIVGGGSAGWMTATTLLKAFPNKKISLIESPNISTVGVGESTIGGFKYWMNYVGIDDKHFLKNTDGSYKLSIKFTDFYKKGQSFHYPFGDPFTVGNKADLNDWWIKKAIYNDTPNSDYVDCNYPHMALVNENKFFYNRNKELPSFDFDKDTALNFDATKFALWLRDYYCLPKGVNHIKEDIVSIQQDENGIKSLNNKYTADLYIDCTGFKSLLLGQTLKEPFESYEDLLPNNSAWATRIPYKDKEKELDVYSSSTAIQNGWVWKVPLWSRIGTGYVYSDKFVSDEDALKEFQNYLGTEELNFKKLKMRVGIHKRLFVKNVCAIGLSSGFIEPLESNGLFTIHSFLINLIRNMQREQISQWDKDNFTFQSKTLFRNFAEFVAMHYALSIRDDTEYWKSNLKKTWEEKLINLNPTFIAGLFTAAYHRNSFYYFSNNSGLQCITAGMNWGPTDLPSLLYHDYTNLQSLTKEWQPFIERLDKRKEEWKKIVKNKPTLFQFLKDNIYNEDSTN